jgi:hypothetical protein
MRYILFFQNNPIYRPGYVTVSKGPCWAYDTLAPVPILLINLLVPSLLILAQLGNYMHFSIQ